MERAEEDSALKEMERLSDGALKGDGETFDSALKRWRDL